MDRRQMLAAGAVGVLAGGAGAAGPARPSANRVVSPGVVSARDGTRLFVRDWGRGRPVLFVHSWALDSTMWSYQVAALGGAGLRCVAFDRRGHGRSDAPGSGYDLDTLADDVRAVIEHFDLRNVVLVGHSLGGAEVVHYLARHGRDRIGRVVLLAPTTPYLTRTADNPHGAPAAYFSARRAEWLADFPKWVEDNRRPFFTPETSPALQDWLVRMMTTAWLPALVACSEAMVATDLRPDLSHIDRPTLVIHGTRDASAPLEITGRPTAAGIRNAELRIYEDAPHGLFVTHAARLNADLLAFIRS